MAIDTRPEEYLYWKQLLKHIKEQGKDESIFKTGEFIWPRQFEIHLPSNHKIPCQCRCPGCGGLKFIKDLGTWEIDGLELLNNLEGAIPYHIYGGAYTEPTLNPYFITFLATTKKYNNHFGIHTNGIVLSELEKKTGWLTELNRISTDRVDYLSISIDAGTPRSWCKTKGVNQEDWFNEIVSGIFKACNIRERNNQGGHAIRLCYLISSASGNEIDFESIVQIARRAGVDSLRFSIPFAPYNQSFDEVRKYKRDVEQANDNKYRSMLARFLSTSKKEKPYIFYTGPEFTDIDKFTFEKCYYGLYQITYGADGYCYRCSTTATPTAKHCRLGKATSNVNEFKDMITKNLDFDSWNCRKMCFNNGLRCNRMGQEVCILGKEVV